MSLTRKEKVMLYVIHVLEGLRKKGLLQGDGLPITKEGEAAFEQMKRDGFHPSKEEMDEALVKLVGPAVKPTGGV